MRNQRFRKLIVWQKSIDFIESIYRLTSKFPINETYGLISQLRKAAVSVALNIAEGSGAQSSIEFKRFLSISLRSSYEVMCGVEIAQRLNYCSQENVDLLLCRCDEISAMIVGLKKNLP